MKKKLFIAIMLMAFLPVALSSCGLEYNNEDYEYNYDSTNSPEKIDDPFKKSHDDLLSNLSKINRENEYDSLYSLYCDCVEHEKSHGDQCGIFNDWYFKLLLDYMLYGKWIDEEGNYIRMSFDYSDYNDTKGQAWYETNLNTSKKKGNNYYYYTEKDKTNYIIGYQDIVTEEKTANFLITFEKNYISLYSYIDQKSYLLKFDTNTPRTIKGNAKKAYICIAKKIFNFKFPTTVKVTKCFVDNNIVYARIQASNGFGGTTSTDYELYETNGYYFMYETDKSFSTNIDLDELNEKLQAFVETAG